VDPAPVTLQGRHVRLEPLSLAHHADLCRVGLQDEIWRWGVEAVRTPEEMRAYVETALAERSAGQSLPFAIVHRESGRAVGSTRYGNIARAHRRVEIGWTWLGIPWQRTAVNTEAKLLLLEHAFSRLGCIRVEFKTDSLNSVSRAALLRIGATEEGTFKNHMITSTGRIRHTVYFGITVEDWPRIESRLRQRLDGVKT
jgi:RimJ/RimL family protein N-acetyltransferase